MKKKHNYLQYFLLFVLLISFSIDLEAKKKKRKCTVAVGNQGSEDNPPQSRINMDQLSCLPIMDNTDTLEIEIKLNLHICPALDNTNFALEIQDNSSNTISSVDNDIEYNVYNYSDHNNIVRTNTKDVHLLPSDENIGEQGEFARAIITFKILGSELNNLIGSMAEVIFTFNANQINPQIKSEYIDIGCCQATKTYQNDFNTAQVGIHTKISQHINTNTNFDDKLKTDYIFQAGKSITFEPGTYLNPSELDPVGLGDKKGSLLAKIDDCTDPYDDNTAKTSSVSLDKSITNPPKYINNHQVNPNPFINNTLINYTLSKDATVSLVVYDMTGRKVHTLVNQEQQTTGTYQVTLEGNNLPNGLYHAVINVNHQQESFKIMKIN